MIKYFKKLIAANKQFQNLDKKIQLDALKTMLLYGIIIGIAQLFNLVYYYMAGYSKSQFDFINLVFTIVTLLPLAWIAKWYVRVYLPKEYKEIYGKY